jgi:hypothetical protein
MAVEPQTGGMLEIQALITREAMRSRLAGALAGDPVLPERPNRPRRRPSSRRKTA